MYIFVYICRRLLVCPLGDTVRTAVTRLHSVTSLPDCPKEILRKVQEPPKNNRDVSLFLVHEGFLLDRVDVCISGVRCEGWGLYC